MSSAPTVSELLSAVKQLKRTDFDDFFAKIQTLHGNTADQEVNTEEQQLLSKINSDLPRATQVRWQLLLVRRDEGVLSEEEKAELIRLTEIVEGWETERLEYMIELAELCQMSLQEVQSQYKIRPRPHAKA